MLIAGHSFVDQIGGRACSACGQLWVNIAGTTEDDVGKLGIAHTGSINANEIKEIRDEVTRIWQAVFEISKAPK